LWGPLAASRLLTDRGSFWQMTNVFAVVASVWLAYETVVGPLRRAERASRAEQLNLELVARASWANAEKA
jgi:hypothetical protein